MRVAVFSTKSYDRAFLQAANRSHGHELVFLEARLTRDTSTLAAGFPVVCAFVNDQLDEVVLDALVKQETRLIALRSAGFNNVDLSAAQSLKLRVVRVPAYSPYAVAEYTVGLILTLNRKVHRAHRRVRDGNLSLDGLMGFDMHGRIVGIVGTGKVGTIVARIMRGFGCTVLAYDPFPNRECEALGVEYVPFPALLKQSDIVTLHCPLTPETHHMINRKALEQMKTGVMLINTSRGPVIDTRAMISALKSGHIGYLGLDVYEEEADLFFEDLSNRVIQDDVFARLLTFPNVIITAHQAFFTDNALQNIAETTLSNIKDFELGRPLENEVTVDRLVR